MTIKAKVICDSISPDNKRITTFQLRYPRFIHSELLTHRQFSRNSSSSRAIPVERLIQDIIDDPVIPIYWGKNKPGMQAEEECDSLLNLDHYWPSEKQGPYTKEEFWLKARDEAIRIAETFANFGYHKQIVNRILEPYVHMNTVITSTEWSNFFALRLHKDAQPEIQELARVIKEALDNSIPNKVDYNNWHLPYIQDNEKYMDIETKIKISIARCASVSYKTVDGQLMTVERAVQIYDKLLGSQPIHASPAEHVARPSNRIKIEDWWDGVYYKWDPKDEVLWGNFKGWVQYRKTLNGECQ